MVHVGVGGMDDRVGNETIEIEIGYWHGQGRRCGRWFANLLSSSASDIPFRCLAELDETAADLQSDSLAQATDGLRLVQTCWRMCEDRLGC